jgi:hypothetical protein
MGRLSGPFKVISVAVDYGGRDMSSFIFTWALVAVIDVTALHATDRISFRGDIDGYMVRAEMPGFKTKDLERNIKDRRLIISGKRQAREERKDKKPFTLNTAPTRFFELWTCMGI